VAEMKKQKEDRMPSQEQLYRLPLKLSSGRWQFTETKDDD
jgi:hypothetical protein